MAKDLLVDSQIKKLLAAPVDADGNPLALDARGQLVVRNAKPHVVIEGKRVRRISDGDNLYIKVKFDLKGNPWYWTTRTAEGKETEVGLGHYPRVSLAEARKKRDKHAADAASANPVFVNQVRKAKRTALKVDTNRTAAGLAPAGTVVGLLQDYAASKASGKGSVKDDTRAQWAGWHRNYLGLTVKRDEETDKVLDVAAKGFGAMDPRKVTTEDVVTLLNSIADGTHPSCDGKALAPTANAVRKHLKDGFEYGRKNKRCDGGAVVTDANDRVVTCTEAQTIHRPRCESADVLAAVLQTLHGHHALPANRTTQECYAALVWQALLFQRPENTVAVRWDELSTDEQGQTWWTIKRCNLKIDDPRRADHRIPLPRQAVAVLDIMRPITGDKEYVFFSSMQTGKHIHLDRISNLMRAAEVSAQQSAHGFRGTGATLICSQLDPDQTKNYYDMCEAQLDHRATKKVLENGQWVRVHDPLKHTYSARNTHDEGRIAMLQEWADYLDTLIEDKVMADLAVARPAYKRPSQAVFTPAERAERCRARLVNANAVRLARQAEVASNDAEATAAA